MAILLNDDYYHFLRSGKKELDGLSFIGPEHLVPLKAKAWLDLSERKRQGDSIDSRSIKKHKNDVFRLYQILKPDFDGHVAESIRYDLSNFCKQMEDQEVDLRALGLGTTDLKSVLASLRAIYRLDVR